MYTRSLIVLSLFSALCLPTTSVFAAELPAGVFQMKDGSYFHPATNTIKPTLEELLQVVGPLPMTPAPEPDSKTVSAPVLSALELTIERARAMLQSKRTETTTTEDSDWKQVELILWNKTTDAMRSVTILKNGAKIKAVEGDISGLRVTFANGVNSAFASDKGEVVLAVRYPITTSIGTKKRPQYKNTDVIYTPYSAAIHQPETVLAGSSYIDQVYAQVFDRLKQSKTHSRAFPEKTLAEATDLELAKLILMIEHVDNTSVRTDALRQVERFLVTMALNKDDAYDYSRSSAGALGLVQFIPSTYASMVRLYPDLQLEPDFEKAMRDPVNSLTAQVVYLDYLLAQFPQETRNKAHLFPSFTQEIIAAAYNGGPARVKKAMVVWEENLDSAERLHVLSRSRLKKETMQYVVKLRLVRPALMRHVQMALATK
ncbi:transglycosylase SLT domain-containing protein [Candidatus Uhrbacteria bacterium]|nr:transglycosylase SLT domain-containing protein [Candidatus Uhrbacteria bacterium]